MKYLLVKMVENYVSIHKLIKVEENVKYCIKLYLLLKNKTDIDRFKWNS